MPVAVILPALYIDTSVLGDCKLQSEINVTFYGT